MPVCLRGKQSKLYVLSGKSVTATLGLQPHTEHHTTGSHLLKSWLSIYFTLWVVLIPMGNLLKFHMLFLGPSSFNSHLY